MPSHSEGKPTTSNESEQKQENLSKEKDSEPTWNEAKKATQEAIHGDKDTTKPVVYQKLDMTCQVMGKCLQKAELIAPGYSKEDHRAMAISMYIQLRGGL